MKVDAFQVGIDYLPFVWPEAKRLLERDRRALDLHPLYHKLQLGERQLWMAIELRKLHQCYLGVAFTEWLTPDALLLHLAAGYRLSFWLPALAERLAAHRQKELRIYARKGWKGWMGVFTEAGFTRVTFARDRPTERGRPRVNRVPVEIGGRACPSTTKSPTKTSPGYVAL